MRYTAPRGVFAAALTPLKPDGSLDLENVLQGVMEKYPPSPALIKGLLARWHAFPRWNVCPPVIPETPKALDSAAEALRGPFFPTPNNEGAQP